MSLRKILRDIFSLKGDTADHEVIKERIVSGGEITGSNMCILMLAIFIASIGLNMNSTAVIIGAMLISPLMGSILSAAYGTATIDMPMFVKSIIGFIIQITICLITSTLYFMLSPISKTTSEILARTQPTIWDVLIALFGGIAGIIGITRKEKSNVIPGVAIATALMPPLCTCGYGIATTQFKYVLGAFYLFSVNSYFIFIASVIVLLILEIPQERKIEPAVWKRLKKALIRNTMVMIIPSLVVAYNMVQKEKKETNSITGFETQKIDEKSVANQMKKLFPEIISVEFGKVNILTFEENEETVSNKNHNSKNEQINNVNMVTVTVNKELTEDQMTRLNSWLELIYDDKCSLHQRIVKEGTAD